MMKRIFSAVLALLLVFVMPLGLFSCTSEKSGGNVLYVYNWGEYISDGSEDSYDTNSELE